MGHAQWTPITDSAFGQQPTMGETLTDASLSTLERVDGSATYSHNGYMIIAAVNGPIEVQRKDELPEEAVVDVTVRLAAGIGGILFLDYCTISIR